MKIKKNAEFIIKSKTGFRRYIVTRATSKSVWYIYKPQASAVPVATKQIGFVTDRAWFDEFATIVSR